MLIVRTLVILLALAALTLPGAASVRASPAGGGVSLDRGWAHRPVVAPGLVITGGLPDVQLVTGGPGLVAYQQQGGSFRMYASATGQDWHLLPGPTFGPGDIVEHLFVVGQRLIITGRSPAIKGKGLAPRIWTSANGGRTWHVSKLQVEAVIPGGDGVIAFASVRSSTGLWTSELWTSADGTTWRKLPIANGAFAPGAVGGGPGYVAGGFTSEVGHPGRATVWTSRDGRAWTEVPDAARIFAGSATTLSQMVAGPAGVVAVGEIFDETSRNAIWASRDGIHWRRAADGFLIPPALLSLPLAAWQGGFAEVRDLGTGAELYSSRDGLTWTREGGDPIFGGSAWVTGMTGYRGGMAAIGGFALHPSAQCLSNRNAAGGLVTREPSAFLWTPGASRTAPAPTLDPFDPWALRLLPQDVPSGSYYVGQYVNLCGYLPSLGRHRAYLLQFGAGARGLALDIVTQGTTAAQAAFRQVDRLVARVPWSTAPEPVVTVQRMRELRATARIGNETRLFTIHVSDYECGDLDRTAGDFGNLDCTTYHYRAAVVVWRQGRVIGLVVTDKGRSFAMELAGTLLARAQHPSD